MNNSRLKRVILIVLDSVGCGDAPDANEYGDTGSNTLGNLSHAVGGIDLPNLENLGLGNLTSILGVSPVEISKGAYGRLTEVSSGKDTTTGHWELSGIVLDQPFPVYPKGFPEEIISQFEDMIDRRTLGNIPASGTEIIKELGEEHLITGMPIVYTSADSVFQVAAHEAIIPVAELYDICDIARQLLSGEHGVGRVIARPFIGSPGGFIRTEHRKDFSLEPPSDTILDVLKSNGYEVVGVGKIDDIFSNRGLTQSNHTKNNMAGIDAVVEYLEKDFEGLIFANLVDFDSLFGHRNDPQGYAAALESFDKRLPEIVSMLDEGVLIITADHGNDPTTSSTDHSRERVPILIYGVSIKQDYDIGTRDMFCDVAATIADFMDVDWRGPGSSFASEVLV